LSKKGEFGFLPGLALAVTEGVQQRFFGHKDCFRVAGAFTKAAANDAQEGFNDLNLSILGFRKNILGADFNALPAAVAQCSGNGREPGDLLAWMSLPGAVIPHPPTFAARATLIIAAVFSQQSLLIIGQSGFGDVVVLPDAFDQPLPGAGIIWMAALIIKVFKELG
jgi:hypothetical protein